MSRVCATGQAGIRPETGELAKVYDKDMVYDVLVYNGMDIKGDTIVIGSDQVTNSVAVLIRLNRHGLIRPDKPGRPARLAVSDRSVQMSDGKKVGRNAIILRLAPVREKDRLFVFNITNRLRNLEPVHNFPLISEPLGRFKTSVLAKEIEVRFWRRRAQQSTLVLAV